MLFNFKMKCLLLTSALLCALASAQHCEKDNCFSGLSCDKILLKPRKKTTINLLPIDEDGDELWRLPRTPKIFFIESSGRDYLMPRQACSVESAVRNSGIDTIVVAFTSKGGDFFCSHISLLFLRSPHRWRC